MASQEFWTDSRQAQERIAATYVLYDGKPFYVRDVANEADYDDRVARVYGNHPGKERKWIPMNDEKFNKFRLLPLLGWINSTFGDHPHAVYLSRTAKRTRLHGLSNNNTTAYKFRRGSLEASQDIGSTQYMADKSYLLAHDMEKGYPSLEEILLNVRENSAIAYSPTFCVYRCGDGVRWLYRKKSRIGMFVGADTLSLFPKLGYYREEIMEDEKFTLNTIREF